MERWLVEILTIIHSQKVQCLTQKNLLHDQHQRPLHLENTTDRVQPV